MSKAKRQIELKNRAIHQLNQTTSNVYEFNVEGSTSAQQIIEAKQQMAHGNVPSAFWTEEMKITRKDWKIIAVAVVLTALVIFTLLKTKVIKL